MVQIEARKVNRRVKRESGLISIWIILIVAIGSLLVVPMLSQQNTGLNYHQLSRTKTLNTYAADAGIQYVLAEIYNNSAEYQIDGLHEVFEINGRTVNVTANYVVEEAAYSIVSIATSSDGRSSRISRIDSLVIINIGLFGNVLAVNGNLELVQSDLTADDPEVSGTDVYANGNIEVTTSLVSGDVTATGNVTFNSGSITGNITEGAEELDFPPIILDYHRLNAQAGGNYTGTYTSGGLVGPLYIDGDWEVTKTNNDITLTGTVYVTGNVLIHHNDILGYGDIVAEGDIELHHHSYETSNPITLPMIATTGGNIYIHDVQGDLTEAVLYAPMGWINLVQLNLRGSVAAQTVTLNQSQIFYPSSLRGRPDLPGAGLEIVKYTIN
jgi:hypothetical protein